MVTVLILLDITPPVTGYKKPTIITRTGKNLPYLCLLNVKNDSKATTQCMKTEVAKS